MFSWRSSLALTLGVVSACGLREQLAAVPKGIDDLPHVTHAGTGWSVRMLEGSKVTVAADRVSVDSPDGAWWFDVSWHDGALPPIGAAEAWASATCTAHRWDLPAARPDGGAWTLGGLCTIEHRRHWMVVVMEPHGDRALLTGIMGRMGFAQHEDVWVELVRSALSLRTGAEPATWAAPDDVRKRLRAIDPGDPNALLPVPGGGVFSELASRTLDDVWAARKGIDVPGDFVTGAPLPVPVVDAPAVEAPTPTVP